MLSFDNVMFMTNCYVRSRLFESFTFASICYMFASMAKTNYTHSPHRNKLSSEQNQKTYNSRDSLVVTHPTTNRPACGLSTAERTGSPVFHTLWSYVVGMHKHMAYIDVMKSTLAVPLGGKNRTGVSEYILFIKFYCPAAFSHI